MKNRVFEAHSSFIREVLRLFEEKVLLDCPSPLLPGLLFHLEGLKKTKGWRIGLVKAAADLKREPYSLDRLLSLGVTACGLHEISLIIDDILDGDRERRGQLSLHERIGEKRAGFVAGWLMGKVLEGNSQSPTVLTGIERVVKRVTRGEAEQEALHHGSRPTSLEVWRALASDDTGPFFFFPFEVLGVGGDWREWVSRLALLYHGLDDLEDLLGEGSLSGGGGADLRDGVPTLPTCFTSARDREGLRAEIPEAKDYLQKMVLPPSPPPLPLLPFFSDLTEALASLGEEKEEKGGEK